MFWMIDETVLIAKINQLEKENRKLKKTIKSLKEGKNEKL